METITRKSFIKFLASGIAVTAASSALAVIPTEEHILKEDFYYDLRVHHGLDAGVWGNGKKMKEELISALKNRWQNSAHGDREQMFRDLGKCGFILDTYEPFHGGPLSERIDRTTLTAEWWRTFCTRYGIC